MLSRPGILAPAKVSIKEVPAAFQSISVLSSSNKFSSFSFLKESSSSLCFNCIALFVICSWTSGFDKSKSADEANPSS